MVVFHDLNVLHDHHHDNTNQLRRCAAKLGYNVVAVGHICNELDKTTPCPASPAIDKNEETEQPIKQLSRLTVVLSEGVQTHKLRHDNVQSYDILAVQPTTGKMFHTACTSLEIDIISVNMTEKLPFYFKTHAVSAALERGIYFEIPYAPAIKDSTTRRYITCNAINLVRACGGKNVIISSSTNKTMELRGPHDVANLGILFGLNENQAKDAVHTNCRAVLIHAATRKSIRSSMGVQEVSQLATGDTWKIKTSEEESGVQKGEITPQGTASKGKQKKRKSTSDRETNPHKVAKTHQR